MPKHIHQFYKQETQSKSKYMWKCTSCSWFVHAGLEHVIVGKSAYCWNCGDTFQMDGSSLSQDKPMCFDCSALQIVEKTEQKVTESKTEIETEEEKQKRLMREQIFKGMFK